MTVAGVACPVLLNRRDGLLHFDWTIPVFGRTLLLVEMAPFQRLQMWLLKTYYPFGGVFDKLYEVRRRSFAFDVQSSPFASAEDNYSFYSLDRWGSLELREFSDGYIVLCSFQEAQPVHPVARWIVTTSDSLDVFGRMSPDKRAGFGSIQGLLQALADESPKNMRVFHAVGTAGYAQ